MENIMGQRLYDQRISLGLTREDVANKIGVSPASITSWENGTNNISPSNRIKVAVVYSIPFPILSDLCLKLQEERKIMNSNRSSLRRGRSKW